MCLDAAQILTPLGYSASPELRTVSQTCEKLLQMLEQSEAAADSVSHCAMSPQGMQDDEVVEVDEFGFPLTEDDDFVQQLALVEQYHSPAAC